MYSLGSMVISKEKKDNKNSFAGRKVTNARQTTAPRVGPFFLQLKLLTSHEHPVQRRV